MGKPFLVVSDLHLGAVPASTEQSFRRFLEWARSAASGLLINGDLFEFGIAYRSVIPSKHYRVLAKIADLVDSGVPVYFTAGNHDHFKWGGHALEAAGVTLLQDCTVLTVGNRKMVVTHGDTASNGASNWERRVARSRVFVALMRSIHPDLIARIQPYTTSTRKQVRRLEAGLDSGPKRHVEEIRNWAAERLRSDPSLDFIVAGHCHLPAKVEVSPDRYYLNAGDWISHYTYLLIPTDSEPPTLWRWTEEDLPELVS